MTPHDDAGTAGNGSTPHSANGAIPHTGRASSLLDDLAADAVPDARRTSDDAIGDALRGGYSLPQWRADLQQLAEGSRTGFDALDDLGWRWMPGKLYATIARPGGGKTALMLEALVRFLRLNPNERAVFCSWEEPLSELVLRLILAADADACAADSGAAFAGDTLSRPAVREWGRGATLAPRLAAASLTVGALLERLVLVDGDALGRDAGAVLRGVGAWMRAEQAAGAPRVGLVAVDYYQKLRTAERATSRQIELAGVSDLLRRFAKGAALDGGTTGADAPDPAFAVPVIVGAQVTRGEGNEEHPSGDRIREADDLLNDAAGVLALSWARVEGQGSEHDEVKLLRVSVPKNRDGSSRPDKQASFTWRPARHWIANGALREGGTGPIVWTPTSKPAEAGTGKAAPRATPRVVD